MHCRFGNAVNDTPTLPPDEWFAPTPMVIDAPGYWNDGRWLMCVELTTLNTRFSKLKLLSAPDSEYRIMLSATLSTLTWKKSFAPDQSHHCEKKEAERSSFVDLRIRKPHGKFSDITNLNVWKDHVLFVLWYSHPGFGPWENIVHKAWAVMRVIGCVLEFPVASPRYSFVLDINGQSQNVNYVAYITGANFGFRLNLGQQFGYDLRHG